MKKYGFNGWLLVPGVVLLITPLMMWLRFVVDLLLDPHKPTDWAIIAKFGCLQSIALCVLAFVGASTKYNARLKARQASEDKPLPIEKAAKPTQTMPLKQALIYTFGSISAFVGALSLTAHLLTGRVSATQVVAFTLTVPLCFVAGLWILKKAEIKEPQNEVTPQTSLERVQGMPTCVVPVKNIVAEQAPATLTNRHD